MAEISTASEAEAKFQTARSHWKLPRLGSGGGHAPLWTLTSLFVVQRLWLTAGEGRPATLGPEAQRETGPRPWGSTGFLGNRSQAPQPACHVGRVESVQGLARWVTAHLHTHFLPPTDALHFNSLLCTSPDQPLCHTSWKNPQVRDDCQRPV